MQLAGEHVHHHVALVQPQQAVVDEHAGQLVADGAVDQRRRHTGIDPARQAQDHLLIAHLGADGLHGLGDVVAHHPVGLRLADLQHEALQDRPALHRVRDFGVELHGVEVPRLVGHAGNGAARRAGHELEAGWQLGHLVAVAHPHLEHAVAFGCVEILDVLEQIRVAARAYLGVAELALVAALHLAAQLLCHGLHAVADAQHRHAQLEHRLWRAVGGFFVGAGVAAGQDHAFQLAIGGKLAHPVAADVAGVHFAVDVRLADAAGDELGDLGAEVEDEDLLVLHGGRRGPGRPAGGSHEPTGAGAGKALNFSSFWPLAGA